MELFANFATGVAVIVGCFLIGHFIYVALCSPESMGHGISGQELPRSWGRRAYLLIVVLSWTTFTFSGAYGLLSRVLGDGAFGISGLVALISIGLLVHIERSAHVLHSYRTKTTVLTELEKLIEYASIPSSGTIEKFKERARTADLISDREAYSKLADIAATLSERDNKLCKYATDNAYREASERVAEREIVDKAARAIAERRDLRGKLRGALITVSKQLPIVKQGDPSIIGEALVDCAVVQEKWLQLAHLGEQMRHAGPHASMEYFLAKIIGARRRENTWFQLELVGDERDGHYEAVCFLDGQRRELADGLIFEMSFDGQIAAFFLRAALPGCLAWGHGFYDRDQEFIFSQERTIDILELDKVSADDDELRRINVPAGLRLREEEEGTLALSCLTYLPGNGFYDFSVRVSDGLASRVIKTKLLQWGQGILY